MKTIPKILPKILGKTDQGIIAAVGSGGPSCDDGIVVNGCFDTSLAGWTALSWEWFNERAKPIHVSSNSLQQTVDMDEGDPMTFSFDYHLEAGAVLYIKFGDPAGVNDIVISGPVTEETYVGNHTATGDTIQFAITGAATLDDWIDNVKIVPRVFAANQFVMQVNVTGGTMAIPCQNDGTFNATINWNDGNGELPVTTFDSANLTYTGADGVRIVVITGVFPTLRFSLDSTSAAKVTKVLQLGDMGWLGLGYAFSGCVNMTSLTIGQTDTSGVADFGYCFAGILNLTEANLQGLSTVGTYASGVQRMFRGWESMANTPDFSMVTVDDATSLGGMFEEWFDATTPPDVSHFNTPNVTLMDIMFARLYSANALPYMGNFDMSKVTSIFHMVSYFNSAVEAENTGIANWQIPLVTNGTSFALETTFTTSEYDAILEAWSQQTLQPNVTIHFGNSTYTNASARSILTSAPNNWILTDGGPA